MSSSGSNLENYLIPLEEINRATENFSKERFIGGGGFGKVYKGQLSARWGNQTAAIKRLDPDSYQGEREFRNEIEMISKFHHENIISFVGYCDEEKEMIIVYEYAINGSLDHHLDDPNKMRHITWTQRLKICLGAARGLNYLHFGLGEHDRVIHRDVKSANILLDGNLVAKVCDFGLSKVGPRNQHETQLNTKVAGTQFYMDPSYHESGILGKESDVYSFGVVLFEMLSGMLVYRQRSIGNEKQFLMNSVRRYHHNEPEKIIDPYIRDQIESKSFDAFKEIAYQCISLNLTDRPAMETVIKKIDESLSCYAEAIPLFTGLLTASDSKTQASAVAALLNLSRREENIGTMVSSGAVPGLVHVLTTGTIDARVDAACILVKVCENDESIAVTIDAAAAIPFLVLLLTYERHRNAQASAAAMLVHLCKFQGNAETAVRAGVVPYLMTLLNGSRGGMEFRALRVLGVLSSCPEVKLAMRNAETVSSLVLILGSVNQMNNENAVAFLVELCSINQRYLSIAQERGVKFLKRDLMDVVENGTDRGKEMAKQLLEMIEAHGQCCPACVLC